MLNRNFTEFKEEIRTTLTHLFEPDFEFPEGLLRDFKVEQVPGSQELQEKILSAIVEMEPPDDSPSSGLLRRYFESLYLHYNLRLTQEEVANRLHLSVRHLQRIQAEAVHLLAGRMWQQYIESAGLDEKATQAIDWQSQAAMEFSLLRDSSPDVSVDIESVIKSVLEMDAFIVSAYGIKMETGNIQPSLVTPVHPSILRQTIISAISALAHILNPLTIKFYSILEGGKIKITLAGPVGDCSGLDTEDLTRDILLTPEMKLEVICKHPVLYLNIRVPIVGERNVLVVEDNPDMVYYYRRCTTGTIYHLHHIASGKDLFPAIEAYKPDIILLDVMLPDIDGWQLLTNLHERAISREIPVVVCSVVKEANLALALGACICLPKPVQPQRLVEALDQAYDRSQKEAQADRP